MQILRHIGNKRDLLPMWRLWKNAKNGLKSRGKVRNGGSGNQEKCGQNHRNP